MVARVSGILFDGPLKSVIGQFSNTVLTTFRLYKGSLPTSLLDTLSDANCLSASSVGATAAGPVGIPTSACWATPSSGVTILTSSIAIPIRASGLPASPIPGFLRFFMHSAPVMDIEVSDVRGSQVAQLSSIAAVTAGQVISLMDLRFRIATSGAVSFNNSTASAILKQITSQSSYLSVPAQGTTGYWFGYPNTLQYNPSTGVVSWPAAAITASAYDGPIPASANSQATGTKLWEKAYSSTSEFASNIWNVSGNTMDLIHTFTANALADGTPTYIRIVKNEVITNATTSLSQANFPRFELQVPVGSGGGAANFTVNSFVTGQPATLNPFTISFLLPEAV